MRTQDLFAECSAILEGSYPESMVAIDTQVHGPGFFPGASGFFHTGQLSENVPRPLMFVGQDFGTADYLPYLKSHPQADVEENTGAILRALLKDAGIDEKQCFFTNALFGVRTGNEITGKCDGWRNKGFVERCEQAFRLQLNAVKPRAIICLGGDAPRMLRRVFKDTRHWQQWSYAKIDSEGKSVIEIANDASVTAIGILVHPSFHYANVWRRKYDGLEGRQAEIAILKRLVGKAAIRPDSS